MSNTQILQWLQSANGRIPSDALNRIAKSVWMTVAAPLKAMLGIGEDPDAPPTSVFIADAFRPTADGASSSVALRRGIALHFDASVGDDWTGDVKPLYADTDQVVAFTVNNDASGDDRIDLLVIRPSIEEEDPQTVSHKDTLAGPVYTKTVNTRRNLGFALDVIEGSPNAAPVAPATPTGWVAIARVTRPNGQAAVLTADIEDIRTREFARFGSALVQRLLIGDASFAELTYDEAANRLEGDTDIYANERLATRLGIRFGSNVIADADSLHLDNNSALNPSVVSCVKGDGTFGTVKHLLGARAWGFLRFDSGTGTWIVDYGQNVGAVTDNGAGDWDLAISPALESVEAIALASFQNSPQSHKVCAIVDATNNVHIEIRDNTGTLADPAGGTRIAIVVFGGF